VPLSEQIQNSSLLTYCIPELISKDKVKETCSAGILRETDKNISGDRNLKEHSFCSINRRQYEGMEHRLNLKKSGKKNRRQ